MIKSGKALFIALLVLVVYLVHQDYWNWKKTEPLIFGFLPIGLAYHAGYSVLASILMAVLVRIAWPKHLEDTQSEDTSRPDRQMEGH
jgi:hypothetical protein